MSSISSDISQDDTFTFDSNFVIAGAVKDLNLQQIQFKPPHKTSIEFSLDDKVLNRDRKKQKFVN